MVLTYKQKFNKKYGFSKDEPHSIKDIAKITGYCGGQLQIIFNKGVRPSVNSPEEWGMTRIYSSIMGGKASVVDKEHLVKKCSCK